jgi:hypothetical protein
MDSYEMENDKLADHVALKMKMMNSAHQPTPCRARGHAELGEMFQVGS